MRVSAHWRGDKSNRNRRCGTQPPHHHHPPPPLSHHLLLGSLRLFLPHRVFSPSAHSAKRGCCCRSRKGPSAPPPHPACLSVSADVKPPLDGGKCYTSFHQHILSTSIPPLRASPAAASIPLSARAHTNTHKAHKLLPPVRLARSSSFASSPCLSVSARDLRVRKEPLQTGEAPAVALQRQNKHTKFDKKIILKKESNTIKEFRSQRKLRIHPNTSTLLPPGPYAGNYSCALVFTQTRA